MSNLFVSGSVYYLSKCALAAQYPWVKSLSDRHLILADLISGHAILELNVTNYFISQQDFYIRPSISSAFHVGDILPM